MGILGRLFSSRAPPLRRPAAVEAVEGGGGACRSRAVSSKIATTSGLEGGGGVSIANVFEDLKGHSRRRRKAEGSSLYCRAPPLAVAVGAVEEEARCLREAMTCCLKDGSSSCSAASVLTVRVEVCTYEARVRRYA